MKDLRRSAPDGTRNGWPLAGRSRRWLALLGLVWLGTATALGAEVPVSKEYRFKAAFLYNFTKFVEWPAARFVDETSPIIIAVLGEDPLQILINLVRNANDACEESGRTAKLLTVRTTSDGRGVKIAISDNGVGIPAENLLRIFNHGFTTRKDGHGFGLHSGALAARQLGGSLSVQSDGPGLGATFTLELPGPTRENGIVSSQEAERSGTR